MGTYEDGVAYLRAEIEKLGEQCLLLKSNIPTGDTVDTGEVIANVMLAYRHLVDARMRLGKVFQALEGGVSNNPR